MNQKFLRIIALALVSLMLLLAVACAETPDPVETTEGGQVEGDVTTGNKPGPGNTVTTGEVTTRTPHDVPANLDIGKEVTVLYWSDVEMPEFEQETPSINGVENAIYKRNTKTAEFLGLEKLSWVGVPGNHGQKEEFTEHVGNSYNAGDRKYDIIATYSRTAGHCMIEGYFVDLETIDDTHIDLEKPWWPKSLVDTVMIDDAIYFLSGDISTNALHMMYAFFCNTTMQGELKLPDPVALAISKEWTLPKFMSIVEGVFLEQNGDDKPSVGDRYGFVTEQLHVDAFYAGSNLRMIESDVDDILVLSKDFTSTKLTTLINDLSEFIFSADCWAGSSEAQFVDKNALFTQNRMYLADRKLTKVEFKYACLPTPMYDERQGTYYTTVANPVTLWGIMRDVENDPEFLVDCTAVLEILAYYGYCETSPQIFEVNMKVKYSDEENADTVQCFDLIRDGLVWDLGRIFPNTEMGDYMNELVSRVIVKKLDWASARQTNLMMYRTNLKAVVKKIQKNNNK